MTLRALAIAGARWTSLASAVVIAIQVVQLAVLARMLTPADFGLMAIALSCVAFLQVASDAGLSNAIIHHQVIAREQLATLYWLNVLAGGALALVTALLGPLLAALYDEPLLLPLLALAGLHLFIVSLWQQWRVLAQKALDFAPLAAIETCASLAGLAAAVAIAWTGGGVFALAGGLLTGSIVAAALAWHLLAPPWRPQFRLRLREVTEFLRFGAYAVASDLVNALASQVDVLLGARALGAQGIGLYSTARNMCLQVAATLNPVITRVGLPLMARSHDDRALLRSVYLHTLRMTASANFPLYVALWLFAEEAVALLLGPQWHEAVPVVRLLAWWALLRSSVNPVGSLLMACGRARLAFFWNAAWLLALPGIVFAGSLFGPQGLAAALTASAVVGWLVPVWYFLVRPLCAISIHEYLRELAIPLALALLAGAAGILVAGAAETAFLRLALGVATGAVAYLALSRRFNAVWLGAVRELLGGRANA